MKVLMVDVDGVLVHGRPADGLPLFTYLERDLGLPVTVLQQEFFKPFWADIVTGKEPIEPRLAAVLAKIAPHLETETLLQYWFENDSRLDDRLLEDLAELRRSGVTLHLATNQEHRRAAWLMNYHGLARHFDDIFYSAKLGHRKPSQDFFHLATEAVGFRPEDIGFIDDAPENVEGAQQFGWKAVQWTQGMQLEGVITHLRASATSQG